MPNPNSPDRPSSYQNMLVHIIDDDVEVLASCGFLLSSLHINAQMWDSAMTFLHNTDIMQQVYDMGRRMAEKRWDDIATFFKTRNS